MLNGYSAIQYYNGTMPVKSIFIEDTQLLFVKKGIIRLSYGHVRFEVKQRQVILLKKNILIDYAYTHDDFEIVEYIRFTIKDDLVKEFIKLASIQLNNSGDLIPVTVNQEEKEWLSYMDSLEPYLQEFSNHGEGLVKIKMLELLFQIAETDKCMLEQLLNIREQFRPDIRATIEENLTNALSITQLATLAGRSLSSFRRDFLAIYNMPPSQWIRFKRLEKAKELLNTNMTVTDICYTLGFESIAHFSRLFKSHFGYPPTSHRAVVSHTNKPNLYHDYNGINQTEM